MSQNAQVFGVNKVVLDEAPVDGVLQVFIKGETEPRLRLYADGRIFTGNGTAAPTQKVFPAAQGATIAHATDAPTAISQVNLVIDALRTAGLIA